MREWILNIFINKRISFRAYTFYKGAMQKLHTSIMRAFAAWACAFAQSNINYRWASVAAEHLCIFVVKLNSFQWLHNQIDVYGWCWNDKSFYWQYWMAESFYEFHRALQYKSHQSIQVHYIQSMMWSEQSHWHLRYLNISMRTLIFAIINVHWVCRRAAEWIFPGKSHRKRISCAH